MSGKWGVSVGVCSQFVSRVLESGPGEGRGQAGLGHPWGARPADPQLAKGRCVAYAWGCPRVLSRRCVSANQGPGDREAGSGGRPVIRSPYSPPPRPCDARSERWCRPSARRGGGAVLPLAVAVSRGLRERGSKGTGVSPYRAMTVMLF